MTVPQGVTIDLEGQDLTARGPKGELTLRLVDDVIAKLEGTEISITPRQETKRSRAMWGLQRMLVSNVVVGVSEGFAVELEIFGVGYRAAVETNVITCLLYTSDAADE